jgi:ankyrin repeat protein
LDRFRWIFCQLEVLRDCLPSSVRQTLRELPESLDETYERILKEIKKPNRAHARRVLQCLVVAIRPLRVAELAEVLAVDFDDAEGIPRSTPAWRWEEEELALLSACSSLIAIVQAGYSRVVQFSHFSVKEFLTSSRLATASGEVSNYHIDSGPAHTILGQACLGVLLQIQDDVEGCTPGDHPLAQYAAEHWATHAQFGEVSSRDSSLQKGMEYLFDENKPHFKMWLTLCDIDAIPNDDTTFRLFALYRKSPAAPLYYAALCGFHDLVEHLITKHPQDVNADGGRYVRPLVAALAREHFQTADLLRRNGADPNVRGQNDRNPLHAAAYSGNFEVVRILIECDTAHINSRTRLGTTPLLMALQGQKFKDGSVLRLLLEHGADVNLQSNAGWTPLLRASFNAAPEVVHLLLEHGADINVPNEDGWTPLHWASSNRGQEVVRLLLEHGADINVLNNAGWTPLHRASFNAAPEVVRLLLEHGADINVPDEDGWTPLHWASSNTRGQEVVRLLLEHGSDINVLNNAGWTPLHRASFNVAPEVVRLLLEHGADINVPDEDGWTPLHWASSNRGLEIVRVLIEHGADVEAKNKNDETALQVATDRGHDKVVELLREHGVK